MPITLPEKMFRDAYQGGYAIGAFNINNMEIIQGIVQAGEEEKSPLILQTSAGALRYAGQTYLVKLIEAVQQESNLPICLHLDHGQDLEICKQVIDRGFTSVMIDGSHMPFEDNLELTREVVDYAHPRGVWVEAELGQLAGIEDDVSSEKSVYTDPGEAEKFVHRSGCDSLAVAIGTSHGAYKFEGDPNIDLERLEAITKKLSDYPLVLHGASSVLPEYVEIANNHGARIQGAQGVPEEKLKRAAQSGVCKINIDTDLRMAFTAHVRKYFWENPNDFDPRKYLQEARQGVKEIVKHKIHNVLGSSHRI